MSEQPKKTKLEIVFGIFIDIGFLVYWAYFAYGVIAPMAWDLMYHCKIAQFPEHWKVMARLFTGGLMAMLVVLMTAFLMVVIPPTLRRIKREYHLLGF